MNVQNRPLLEAAAPVEKLANGFAEINAVLWLVDSYLTHDNNEYYVNEPIVNYSSHGGSHYSWR